jgi:site-specific recombinase XerD
MTKLRQQLVDVLTLKGYSAKTREAYVESVAGLAGFHQRSPDRLSDEQIKSYLLALHAKGYAASTLNVRVSGLRFFYRHVLGRSIAAVEAALPRPRRQIRRARVYSLEEIGRLLAPRGQNPKHRVFLMTVYGAGLRLREACGLQLADLESQRGQIRVRQGKGRKDRYTCLGVRLLEQLRLYWQVCRPVGWLFPSAYDPQRPISDRTGQAIFYQALKRAGLPNKGGIHALRHSFATHLLEAGVDVATLKKLMGHGSYSTTAGYLHVTGERLASVKSPLDLIPGTEPTSAP